jgi:hypothetical protein
VVGPEQRIATWPMRIGDPKLEDRLSPVPDVVFRRHTARSPPPVFIPVYHPARLPAMHPGTAYELAVLQSQARLSLKRADQSR